MIAQPSEAVMYDTLLPDPRTVYAVQKVITERGAYIDVTGWLWVVNPNAPIGSRDRFRQMMNIPIAILVKLMASKQVEWNDRAYCYKAANHA